MAKAKLKARALKLRVCDRRSLTEIQGLTGVSKSALSIWLRDHPLTSAELSCRRSKPRVAKSVRHDPRRKIRAIERFGSVFSLDAMDVGHKGRIAEAAVMLRLTSLGFTVYKSAFDGSRVDLIAFLNDSRKVALIQVKWASLAPSSYGRPTFSVQRSLGNRSAPQSSARRRAPYHPTDYDFIVGYDFLEDKAYVFSHDQTMAYRNCMTVTDASEEAWEQVKRFLDKQQD